MSSLLKGLLYTGICNALSLRLSYPRDCILDSRPLLNRLDKQALSARSGQDFRRDRYEKLAKVAHTPGNSSITTCITDNSPRLAPVSTVVKSAGGWGSNSVARLMATHCTNSIPIWGHETYRRTEQQPICVLQHSCAGVAQHSNQITSRMTGQLWFISWRIKKNISSAQGPNWPWSSPDLLHYRRKGVLQA